MRVQTEKQTDRRYYFICIDEVTIHTWSWNRPSPEESNDIKKSRLITNQRPNPMEPTKSRSCPYWEVGCGTSNEDKLVVDGQLHTKQDSISEENTTHGQISTVMISICVVVLLLVLAILVVVYKKRQHNLVQNGEDDPPSSGESLSVSHCKL
jgi:hypothetical protein